MSKTEAGSAAGRAYILETDIWIAGGETVGLKLLVLRQLVLKLPVSQQQEIKQLAPAYQPVWIWLVYKTTSQRSLRQILQENSQIESKTEKSEKSSGGKRK